MSKTKWTRCTREEWLALKERIRTTFGARCYGDVSGIREPPLESFYVARAERPGAGSAETDFRPLRCDRNWLGPNGQRDHKSPGKYWIYEYNADALRELGVDAPVAAARARREVIDG